MNLVQIDEITQLVTLDLKFRLYWFDNRFNVSPAMFNALDPSYSQNGVDLTFLHASGKLSLWLPDLDFNDAQTVTELQVSLRLKPNGMIYWSRHLKLELSQTDFNYASYPMDSQTISLQFSSYAFPSQLLNLLWASPPIQLYNSGNGADFTKNPQWTYDSYSTTTNQIDNSLSSTPRYCSQATLYVNITRESGGIIVRLAIPTLLLVFMGACSFWAKRVDRFIDTIPLVLASAALYIAVLQKIPSVGYLTTYDKFSLSMLTILVTICTVHRLISRIDKGADKRPAYEILIRTGESFCRLSFPLTIITLFISFFGSYFDVILLDFVIVMLSLAEFVILWREVVGVKKALKIFYAKVIKKVMDYKPSISSSKEEEDDEEGEDDDDDDDDDKNGNPTKLELLLFNFLHTMVPSTRIAVALSIVGKLQKKQKQQQQSSTTPCAKRLSDSEQYGLEMTTNHFINGEAGNNCSVVDNPMNE